VPPIHSKHNARTLATIEARRVRIRLECSLPNIPAVKLLEKRAGTSAGRPRERSPPPLTFTMGADVDAYQLV
jgi:hypothetical protein